jgi:hypothetical protein
MLFRCPGKEPLSRRHITPSAQEEVDGAPLYPRAIEVHPLASDFEVSLIHAPRVADRPRVPAPALLKFRHITLPALRQIGLSDEIGRVVHQNHLLRLAREGAQTTVYHLKDFEVELRHATLVAILLDTQSTLRLIRARGSVRSGWWGWQTLEFGQSTIGD